MYVTFCVKVTNNSDFLWNSEFFDRHMRVVFLRHQKSKDVWITELPARPNSGLNETILYWACIKPNYPLKSCGKSNLCLKDAMQVNVYSTTVILWIYCKQHLEISLFNCNMKVLLLFTELICNKTFYLIIWFCLCLLRSLRNLFTDLIEVFFFFSSFFFPIYLDTNVFIVPQSISS